MLRITCARGAVGDSGCRDRDGARLRQRHSLRSDGAVPAIFDLELVAACRQIAEDIAGLEGLAAVLGIQVRLGAAAGEDVDLPVARAVAGRIDGRSGK